MGIISDMEDSIENTQSDELLDKITAFEEGELTLVQVLELFSYLIRSKLLWRLQGNYERTAQDLLDRELIDSSGEIVWENVEDQV